MARADSAATGPAWARSAAIDYWLDLGGAVDVFDVFAAMRANGVDDVRRLGVVGRDVASLRVGRAAGAGAVVGVGDGTLLAAEPDAVVAEDELAALIDARYGPERALRPYVLLNPGPALTTDAVKRAAAGPDLCHREPEFRGLERGLRAKLRAAAGVGDDWSVGLIAGSGTAADELAVGAAVRPGRRLVLVSNGVYGERLHAMATRRGIAVDVVPAGWTEPPALDEVEAALARPDVDALALVHHETTSGLRNPLGELAALARSAGALVVVDAVSSFGAEQIDAADVDLLACSSNKCLHGLPGAAFVLVSPAGRERAAAVPAGSVYLDLTGYLDAADAGTVPFTPAVPALASLDAALDELALEGGVAARGAAYARRAAVLDALFERLGLEQLVAPEHRSRSVRSVRLPAGVAFADLHDEVKREGYVIYAGQGSLAREIFRVCCLGALEPEALEGFGAALERALAAQAVA